MALTAGTRLGHYDVTALLGEGGMGQVWQATDTQLNREVALKILPDAFASDPDRLARFTREAQILASLNHPNIAAIYGIEESEGTRALVLELVEGPTLADRISKGPIPLDEALPIAKQIAEALEAAHEAGVIHRDLKPANIKVREDGTVKVLDFGLAKALDPNPEGDPSELPTLTAMATQMGVIMGTAAYMSPEQARGKPADRRTDVWAFGCVLYEMVTGRRAFAGETVADTLAAVMSGLADWSALPATMSPTLLLFLKHCLNKDPHERVRDLGDVRLALIGAFDSVPGSGIPMATPRRTAWFVGLSAAALLAGVWIGLGLQPSPPIGPVIRSIVSGAPNPAVSSRAFIRDVELSPDGSHVVYTSTEGSRQQLFVRALDSLEGWAIPGSGVGDAAISPDSEWIAFSSNETGLFSKVAVSGGAVVELCRFTNLPAGITWLDADTIVFATLEPTGLMRVSSDGGEVTEITAPNPEEDHLYPHALPDGRSLLFTVAPRGGSPADMSIALLDLETSEYELLIAGGADAQYVDTGHIVDGFDGTLRAVAFDLDARQVVGSPVPVLQDVISGETGAADFALARTGALAYVSGEANSAPTRQLVWLTRDGDAQGIPVQARGWWYPRLSPDGTKVAVDLREGSEDDVWVVDLDRGGATAFTFEAGADLYPIWSPDGSQLIFSSGGFGLQGSTLRRAPIDGGPTETLLVGDSNPVSPHSITSDGTALVYRLLAGQSGGDDLMLLPLDGDPTPVGLLTSDAQERNGELSPNDRWLAYQSDETGRFEVYVRPFPDVDAAEAVPISTAGGTRPAWRRDGRELFYVAPDNTLMAVALNRGPTLAPGPPTPLFRHDGLGLVGQGRHYDVAEDGRFLLLEPDHDSDSSGDAPLVFLVQNWTEELKARVPIP